MNLPPLTTFVLEVGVSCYLEKKRKETKKTSVSLRLTLFIFSKSTADRIRQ
ncbi:hypothetical protein B4088_2765 [Bacillus cereus]|uniref:Uncharacterized protein n=1 Tax=Bacillus cereus TaxID=1396 RepID=A0A164NYX4_BACCE|nr:hypothetical protein B4088_2765 [Bacillus cereus]